MRFRVRHLIADRVRRPQVPDSLGYTVAGNREATNGGLATAWQAGLRAEIEAAARMRAAEGWPLADALRLVLLPMLDQIVTAASDGLAAGLEEHR